MFRIIALLAAALVVGCAGQPDIKPLSAQDPASPHAPESPVTSLVPPLALEPAPAVESETGSKPPSHDQGMPGMGMKGMDMSGMRHGSAPGASEPATRPTTLYTCKMHPQIISDHPGNCPICGMNLIPKAGVK